jgi:hypothetical protein
VPLAFVFLFCIFAITCVIQCSGVRTVTECVDRVLTMDALSQVRHAVCCVRFNCVLAAVCVCLCFVFVVVICICVARCVFWRL